MSKPRPPHPPRPRRKRKPRKPLSPVSHEHFRLLKEYGRNPLTQQITKREGIKLWEMACGSARVPVIPREHVVEEWKKYITGQSKFSGIAINAEVDPQLTTVALTHNERLTAGHTTRTDKLFDKLLELFARCFPNRESFLNAVEFKCGVAANKVWKKE